jgi:hypothetical protein
LGSVRGGVDELAARIIELAWWGGAAAMIGNPTNGAHLKPATAWRVTVEAWLRCQNLIAVEFLKLPTLNHVGMALLQFLLSISDQKVSKNAFGVYEMWFVSFSFPKGEERIRMLVNLKIEKVNAIDKRWLPLEKTEGEFFACEIKHAGQLGQAIRYIEYGREKYMTTRQIPSDTAPLN